MANNCPCFNCPDRYLRCKSTCTRYIEWKDLHEEERIRNFKCREKNRILEVYRSEKKK